MRWKKLAVSIVKQVLLHRLWKQLLLCGVLGTTLCSATTPEISVCCERAQPSQFAANYDFFTNFGNYMPRLHCLSNADGSPDLAWSGALIVLNTIIVIGYLRIFLFWRRCYKDELPKDRDRKLMDLAWIFALCAFCGYGLSTVIFFWPGYRLLAMAKAALAFVTWRFAIDLEPFRKSFTSNRLERQLNVALRKEKSELEAANHRIQEAHHDLEVTAEQLRQTNKDMDEFAYAASHDLRAPLRAIDSLAQFVIEDSEEQLSQQSMDDLNKLKSRVKRMDRMLSGLLEYSRWRRKELLSETFTATEAVEHAIHVLDLPDSFEIQSSVQPVEVFSPRSPLEQILRNLVHNAVKHHHRDKGVVKINSEVVGNMLRFSVEDDGPGIPSDHHDRVFGMFETLRRRDEVDTNGMGLALVKGLTESHGGKISVESVPGYGAKFSFTWPLEFGTQPESSQTEPMHTEEPCLV